MALVFMAAVPLRAQTLPSRRDPQSGIPFEVNRLFGVVLIRAQVNGHPATLLLDTGSSKTILSPELVGIRPEALESAGVPVKGSGYVGTAGWSKATLQFGGLQWPDRMVLVMDFREISKSMEQRVDGILGEDVLGEFDSVFIDFKHRRVVVLR
jgi:aspartyl protease